MVKFSNSVLFTFINYIIQLISFHIVTRAGAASPSEASVACASDGAAPAQKKKQYFKNLNHILIKIIVINIIVGLWLRLGLHEAVGQ